MHDGKVLAACMASRRAYDAVARHVDPSEFSPQFGAWWPIVEKWYDKDPDATAADVSIVREKGRVLLPPSHRDSLLGWYDDLDISASPLNVVDHLLAGKRQLVYLRLQAACSRADEESVTDAYNELAELQIITRESGTYSGDWHPTVQNVFEPMSEAGRIHLMPPQMDKRLRVLRGDHIILIARPNMGKSLTWLNMVGALVMKGKKVCVFENEDPLPRDALRLMANLLDRPTDLVEENQVAAIEASMRRGMNNVRWRKGTPGTVEEIDAWLEREKPDFVVVNQLRNLSMRGQSNNSMVSRLEALGTAVRVLASKHNCVILSVTQAGVSAEGKAVLSMSDLDNSKTGLPGACDHIIAIGATEEMEATGRIMFSFPKVKGPRIEPFMLTTDPTRTRFK